MQQSIENQPALISTLSDGLSFGIIFLDMDCRIVRWNRWMERQTGFRQKKVLGINLFELFPRIKEKNQDQYIFDCINLNKPFFLSSCSHQYLIPVNVLKNDQATKMLQNIKIFPVLYAPEKKGCILIIEDITERVLHEKELNRINTILRGIRNVNQLITQVELEDTLFKKTCEILVRDIGYASVSIGLIENGAYKIKAVEFKKKDTELKKRLRTKLDEPGYECSVTTEAIKTGHPQILNSIGPNDLAKSCQTLMKQINCQAICALPVKVEEKIIGAITYCADQANSFFSEEIDLIEEITTDLCFAIANLRQQEKQKRIDLLLHKSEAKYRSMMEAIQDAVYICSSDFRVEYMNPAMIERIGHNAVGEACHKAINGLDEKCPWCVFNKIKEGKAQNFEYVSPKDERAYFVVNTPIFHSEELVSKLSIFRDITEEKRMAAHLQQSQKLAAIGSLAGGIAHDFNNILFPIFGYLGMMMEDLSENSPLYNSASHVLGGAKRARDLVSQILLFSRKTDHRLVPIKIHHVINEALKLIRSSIPSTIKISQSVDKNCGMVMADVTHIHQITMNLCTNAFHAMEKKGGQLTVILEEVELKTDDVIHSELSAGAYVVLKIADTGHGIDPDIINRIFDPYFTTKEQGKGTGLGLAVVYGIVKNYGGHIDVDSKLNKGTEFKIYLPIIPSVKENPKIDHDLPIQKGNERILLVDDQDVVLRVETKMLEKLGYRVTAQISSIKALKIFSAGPDKFDLVITDMTMPEMQGDELIKKIHGIRNDIPIILCTGYSGAISDKKTMSIGVNQFLIKPIDMKSFAKKIREVLDES